MKKIQFIIGLFIIACLSINAQEKKIKFNSGTLHICSSKNFTIQGYDGDEVVIESMHPKRNYPLGFSYKVDNIQFSDTNSSSATARSFTQKSNDTIKYNITGKVSSFPFSNRIFFANSDANRKKGLKKLGKENDDKELGIYFSIVQKGNELFFKDNTDGQLVMISDEKYNIKIPNSIHLKWSTESCEKTTDAKNKYVFYNSKESSLSNFNGEVEISTSLNNMKLTDVTGPVSINTIGGNVTIEFDKKIPKKLYSVYTNNGFIDITLPKKSNILVDANASSIFSDIDFKVLEENSKNDVQQMKLKLNDGAVKMKLNAGLGNVYLRGN